MNYFKLILFVFLVFSKGYGVDKPFPDCKSIIRYAKSELSNCGVLKEEKGFVYVDLEDDYIHKLYTLIREHGFQEPPYFGKQELVGAHVSVIYPAESKEYKIKKIQELGQKICFELTGCEIVYPPDWPGVEKAYILLIDAPELDELRDKYGLPPKSNAFHITIGIKQKQAQAA